MPFKEIKRFSVGHLQILDDDGTPDPDYDPKLSMEEALKLYRAMLLARRADERMLKLQRQGRLGTFPPCTGQEAVACGAAFAMHEHDWFVPAFRELGGRLMRGEPLEKMLLYYNGFEEGNTFAREKRTLPTSVIVAAHFLHAVGIAYALKYQGKKGDENISAVVAFGGDGATSEGDFHEALNFAALWKVPVVFVIQNNQWAISVPRSKQSYSETLAQKGIAYDIPCMQLDGNDPLAVIRAVRDALDRARKGEGPTLLEAVTYRLMMHTTADDPKKYRSEEEEQKWWKRDPLPRFQKYLKAQGYWDSEKQTELEAELKEEISKAVKDFEAFDTNSNLEGAFNHVFGTKHPEIERQRKQFLDDLKRRQ